MGAYENPRIITPPDYGEIFRRNFQASKQMIEGAFARAEARREKIKKEDQVIDDKILQFDLVRQDIKAGDLTGSLQNATNFLADDFAENERLYSQNQISREEYNGNRVSYFRKLNEMKQIGGFLEQQSKTIKDLDVSAFQKNGAVADGFLKAYQDNKIKFQFVGDDLEMYYLGGPDGKDLIVVDSDNLKDANFFNLNEKYILTEANYKAMANSVDTELRNVTQTTTNKGGVQQTVTSKQYKDGKNASDIIDEISRSNTMNSYLQDPEDAGSLFVDTIFNNSNVKSIEEDARIIASKNGLSKEETELFIGRIKTGTYEDMQIGEDKNYRELVNEVTKRQLAKEAYNKYAPKEQKATATKPTESNETSMGTATALRSSLSNIFNKYTLEGQEKRGISTDQMDLETLVDDLNKFKSVNGFSIQKIGDKYQIFSTDKDGKPIPSATPKEINLTSLDDIELSVAGIIFTDTEFIKYQKDKASKTFK